MRLTTYCFVIMLVCFGHVSYTLGYRGVARTLTTHARHVLKVTTGQVNVNTLNTHDIDGATRRVFYMDKGAHSYPCPIVMLAGTAQTIDTFTPHINQISKHRRLIIPELRGQGRTELDSNHCTIEQLVSDLKHVLDSLGVSEVHLGGFSFGGRVALAFAAHYPTMVRKLSVTAIPLERPPLGKVILASWAEGLKNKNMKECAWSFIINGYSNAFLERHAERMHLYVDMVAGSNDPSKVYNLINQSAKTFPGDIYAIPHCAALIRCPTQVIGATHDRIAGVQPVKQLAQAIQGARYVEMNTGHLAPFEEPLVWRKHVLDFMDEQV